MNDRIRLFTTRLEEAAAERRVPFTHGVGLFSDSVPIVYDANYVRVDEVTTAEEHAAEADALMERFWHRRIATGEGGDVLADGLADLGWTQSTHLVMAHVREPDRLADTSAVREVPLDALLEPHTSVTLAESYGTVELAEQLFEAKRRIAAAVPTRYFAISIENVVAAYCELRGDDTTSQIEDVNTLRAYRGRGLGRIVVQHALEQARTAGDLVFVEALADDWPKDLYTKLGFETVGERHLFLRPPHPLARLRVRTPRLELRLATIAELRELHEVARAGIHDPAFMPFGVAWTDSFTEESFLEWHQVALRDWRPYSWRLELIAFVDGRPVGSQALHADRFGSTRRATTGSWLGASWQGRGLGTEMRAAVLTLLFDGLGGDEAASGAIVGNEASVAVSRKLGYEETGRSTVSPRGTPVEHYDLALTRERFRRPDVPVTIEGLGGLDSLFGVDW
jgi:RimJ/RimL family protein N-acetyltransferase/predicted GNAT family acetyltransferase